MLLIVLFGVANSVARQTQGNAEQQQQQQQQQQSSSLWIAKIRRPRDATSSDTHAAALSRVGQHLQRRGIEAHRTHHNLGMLTAHMEAASVASLLQDVEDIEYITRDREVSFSEVR